MPAKLAAMRISAFAFAAAMLALCACGGGGGTVPAAPGATPTPPGATPTPSPTSSPTSIPQVSSTTIRAAYSAQTARLNALPSGYAASLTFPGTNSTSSLTVTLTTALPSNAPSVSGHVRRQTIGGSPAALVYLTLTPSASYALFTTPALTVTLPASVQNGTPLGLAYYDPTQSANGWQLLTSAFSANGSVAFPELENSELLNGSTTYVYALVTMSGLPTPPPPPTGTGILRLAFTNTVGALSGVQSVVITVNGVAQPPVQQQVNVFGGYAVDGAQVQINSVSNATISAVLYPSPGGTGTPIAFAHGTGDVLAGRTATTAMPLDPVLRGVSLAIAPLIVASGTPTDIALTVTPGGPDGLVPWQTWYDANDTAVAFNTTLSDPTGQTIITKQPVPTVNGTAHYSGSGVGPVTFTVTAGAFSSQYGLQFSSRQDLFAEVQTTSRYALQPAVNVFPAGSATAVFGTVYGSGAGPYMSAFDANGNVWTSDGAAFYEFSPAGAPLSTIAATSGEMLLGFDRSNTLYTGASTSTTVNAYSVQGSSRTLLRTYALPAPPQGLSAAPDGSLYITTSTTQSQQGAIYKYAAGSTVPLTWTFNNVGVTTVDGFGNVYMVKGDTNVYKWPAGTSITATPTAIATETQVGAVGLNGIAVNPDGFGCAIGYQYLGFGSYTVSQIGWTLGGSSSAVCPQVTPPDNLISAPIK